MSLLTKQGDAEFAFSKEVVFDAVCQAVAGISHMRIDTTDKAAGHILVRTSVNLLNFGERIPIQISALTDHTSRVQITSSPKGGIWVAGPIDFGRNRKNIDKILAAISAVLLAQKPAMPTRNETPNDTVTTSVADELKKLKALMDDGILTSQEFQIQKEKLLKQ